MTTSFAVLLRCARECAAKSKALPLACVLAICLSTISCDRKKEPAAGEAPTAVQASPPPAIRRGTKILEADNSDAGAEVARRLMVREKTPALPPDSDDPDALMREYAAATTERKIEILSSLGADGSTETWDFLCQAANEQDQSLRLAALDALAIHQGGDPGRVIDSCLSFPDEETRALAATLLGARVRDADAWAKAATDPSPAVRSAYLAAVEAAPNPIKIAAAKRALASGKTQFRLEAASVLGGAKSKEAADLLIPLLDDPKLFDVASEGLFFFFSRAFCSAAEARDWLSRQSKEIWE